MSGMIISVQQGVIVPLLLFHSGEGDPRKQVAPETITLSEKMTSQTTA